MIITFFGKRGSGKTTAIRALIQDKRLPKPIIVLDVLGNFDPSEKPNDPRWGYAQSAAEMIHEIQKYRSDATDELLKKSEKHPGVVVVQDSDITRAMDYACAVLWELHGGTLVVDETDAIDMPQAPCFDEAIRYGRNRGIWIVTGCRRPAEISKNITAGSDLFYIFRTQEPRDVEYFKKQLPDGLSEKLPKLEKYHGVYVDHKVEKHGTFKSDQNGKITRLEAEELN